MVTKTTTVRQLRTFEDFVKLPVMFYRSIGEDIFDHRSTKGTFTVLLKCLLYVGSLDLNLLIIGSIMYIYFALQSKETVQEAIAMGASIGFAVMASFKQMALWRNKKMLQQNFDKMKDIFPKTHTQQLDYQLHKHERKMQLFTITLSTVCLLYYLVFSLYPICKASVQYYFLGAETFERTFGFNVWYPYDATANNWVYWLTYLALLYAGYVCSVCFMSSDLLLIISVTQLNMHFDYISKQLEEYIPDEAHEEHDFDFLNGIIKQHINCLELCERVNAIFRFLLLLNFLIASMSICFIGFQVTTSTLEVMILYYIFLLESLIQVFVICHYCDELMSASVRVGEAAYNQSWFNGSIAYKKMLVLIIQRSQRAARITPPTFPAVSMETFMMVISMSYKFFALLRTTYYKE